MKVKNISQREFLKLLQSTIESSYDTEIIESRSGETLATRICQATVACLGIYSQDPENQDDEFKGGFGQLYEELAWGGVSFTTIDIVRVGLTIEKKVPFIEVKDNLGTNFYIYHDGTRLCGYVPKGDIDKEEARVFDFESQLEPDPITENKINGNIFIPNIGKVQPRQLKTVQNDLESFNRNLAARLGKWIVKDLMKAMILPSNLGIPVGDKDYVKTLSKERITYLVAALITNIENESLGKFANKVKTDIESVIEPHIEDFEVLGTGCLAYGVPFIECRIRTLESPWIVYYLYNDGKDFRAYVPLCGNWINTDNKQIFMRSVLNSKEDAVWLSKQGISIPVKDGDTVEEVHREIKNTLGTTAILEYGDYVPEANREECLKEFESMFPTSEQTTTTVQSTGQQTKTNDITSLTIDQLELLKETLSNNYTIEANSLISAVDSEINKREQLYKKIDTSKFAGKLFYTDAKDHHTGQDVRQYFKVTSINSRKEIMFDFLGKSSDSILYKKGLTRGLTLTIDGKLTDDYSSKELIELKDETDYNKYISNF